MAGLALHTGCQAAPVDPEEDRPAEGPDSPKHAEPAADGPVPTEAEGPLKPPEGDLATHLQGQWQGKVVGDMADKLEMTELMLQEGEPTETQLEALTEKQKEVLEQQRQKLHEGSARSQKMMRTVMKALLRRLGNISLEADANELTLRMGEKTKNIAYEVLGQDRNELRLRFEDETGAARKRVLRFDGADTFYMTQEKRGAKMAIRFTRND